MALGTSACDTSEDDLRRALGDPVLDAFEIRIRGQDAAPYEKVLLGMGQVDVTSFGQPVRFEPSPNARAMDLSDTGHAHLLGRFFLPRYVKHVDITVRFDDVGAFKEGSLAGLINAQAGTIQFTSTRAALEQRSRVVIHLHLQDSLFDGAGARTLLPAAHITH
ncbi:putative lipoprotein [Corallococcus macrosporus]|uniref:Putative lipoprotein n=1 Tax=Myxococcus fulvus (strain ATCC BAA-855 / HW-1) TaxID=483219 RepID=F8CIM2_MYXFH|nr:putative lipoprotein [Corallococcus macrosporus]